VPSDRARHFGFNRNTLTLIHRHGSKGALPPGSANHATQTRSVVLFCAVRKPARFCGRRQNH
jgi:hypothetical protein